MTESRWSKSWEPGSIGRSRLLVNPRAPAAERERVRAALESLDSPAAVEHFWVSTSGSTAAPGASKWVALSQSAILASAEAVNKHLQSTTKDIWIHALPAFHVGGIGILARASLSGSRVIDGLLSDEDPRWDAGEFHRRCCSEKATLSALVPAQIHDLVQAGLAAPPSLRAIVVGGGALPASLYARARSLGWPLLPSYGLSECASQVATAPLGKHLEMPHPVLLDHVEARISEDGKLALRSAALFTGYGLVEESQARWFDPKDGDCFVTEDRVELHRGVDGVAIRVLGRASDFLKIGGESVDLARLEAMLGAIVEDMLRENPGIRIEASLVPLPDARLGHVIHLALYASPDLEEGLARAVHERFNREALPFERARGMTRLSAPLPRSPLGKILRSRLVLRLR